MSPADSTPAEEGVVVPLPQGLSRDQLRSRRKRAVRARSENVGAITRALRAGAGAGEAVDPVELVLVQAPRPRTRGDCEGGLRPCPYVSCHHHLFLDVASNGSVKRNFPDLEVWELEESCALDVADRGGATLEDVGAVMNVTRERIRQIEVDALGKLEQLKGALSLRDYAPEGPALRRRVHLRLVDPAGEGGEGEDHELGEQLPLDELLGGENLDELDEEEGPASGLRPTPPPEVA